MNDSARRVLVLDGDQASSYAVVRSLAAHGLTVTVADCTDAPLAGLSRYCCEVLRYPAPRQDADGFVDWLEQQMADRRFAYVLPVTDDTLQPIAAARDRLLKLGKIALAPTEAHRVCSDKSLTFEVAEKLGLDVPARTVIHDLAELQEFNAAYPVVVKPATSVVSDGERGRVSLNVRYAFHADELRTMVKEAVRLGPVILQAFAEGTGTGIEVLCDQGEVVAAFQHERLHEWPLTGGGSSYRESVALDQKMLEAARRLMAEIGYHGVAMVEFKHDKKSGKRWLMEINGRFWGSLPLCVHAGADFPRWLIDLELDGKRPVDPGYRVGIRSRKFSRDLFWAVEVLRRTDPHPLIRWPSRWDGLLTWCGILSPKHRFDVQNVRDWKPGWTDFRRSMGLLLKRFSERKRRLAHLERMRTIKQDRIGLARRIGEARRILYLCYGNINRSAVAEADLKRRLGDIQLKIESAGLHEKAGRPADPVMTQLAAAEGFDLSHSQSQTLDAAMVERADLILAMDMTHVAAVLEKYPDATDKCLLHGVFNSDARADLEIADPYGASPEVYESCLKSVLAANSGFIALIDETGNG